MSMRRFLITAGAVHIPDSRGAGRTRRTGGEVVELDDSDPDQKRAIVDLLAMGSAVEEPQPGRPAPPKPRYGRKLDNDDEGDGED